jgi:Domain of unknown function (DUF5666)
MSQRTGWPPLPSHAGPPRPPRRSHSLTIAAVAIAAFVAAVVAAVLIVGGLTGSPSTAGSASSAAPTQGAQGGGAAGGGPVIGGGGGGGGGGGQLFLGGKVTAISETSITLTGQSQTFTAAITSSTKFTGVRGPSGIKVGAEVTAQITGYDSGHPVATAIQDPPAGFP